MSPSKVQKSKFNKVAEVAAEDNQKESWLHNGMTASGYAVMIAYGASDQKQWLSDAAIMKAEADHAFGKDAKEFSRVFQGMKRWLLQNKVGRAGGNKVRLAELAEDEKSFAAVYFANAGKPTKGKKAEAEAAHAEAEAAHAEAQNKV